MPSGELKLGYHSFLDFGATLTASGTASGYALDNLKDRLRFTRWRSSVAALSTDLTWVRIDLGQSLVIDEVAANVIASASASGTLDETPVQPGTAAFVLGASVDAIDDGAGNITGTGVVSGTINYTTGAWSITFTGSMTGVLYATYGYDIAMSPDYLVLTDLQDTLADTPITLSGSSNGSSWTTQVTAFPDIRRVIWLDYDGTSVTTNRHRYWRVEFSTANTNTGRQVTLSNILLGKKLTMPEGLWKGHDGMSVEVKGKRAQSRANVHLGAVIEDVVHRFRPRFSDAGFEYSALATGDSGLLQAPSIDRWLRSYVLRQRPFAVHYDGPHELVAWGHAMPKVAAPFRSPLRQDLTVEMLLDPDYMGEVDA